ncbi:DUF342 domain-containing protein [Brockia lithotrophica]|uniref:Uncharacterized protein DUF342 n=1 Tax=Brockia lithotrophica TaxID=933949 RepID=A0A660KVT7_9BACL|nr:flagellar assembly protein A [Brockia lithotrophica]RKQ85502.1 uncharacterized protein DUF342 [Brockia lithotrophica]
MPVVSGRGYVLDIEDFHVILHLQEADVSREEIVETLRRRGISEERIFPALEEALRQGPGTYVLVQGTPPQPGKAGGIRWLVPFPELNTSRGDESRVDYRERTSYLAVRRGQKIAEVLLPIPGTPGLTVFGKVVPALTPPAPRIRPGKGVRMDEANGVLYAEKDGALFVEERSGEVQVAVRELLEHRGDVDLASGNIHFPGSVVIRGNVAEGMLVEAGEDLVITGQVEGATVRARGSVEIYGPLLRSTAVSGWEKVRFPALLALHSLARDLMRFRGAVEQLRAHSPDATSSPEVERTLALRILEKHFPDLGQRVLASAPLLREVFPEEMAWRAFLRPFAPASRGNATWTWASWLEALSTLLAVLERYPPELRERSRVRVASVHMAAVYAWGDVEVLRRGSYRAEIVADGEIRIPGPVRGGRYSASQMVLGVVGSEAGISTTLEVPETGWIELREVFAETELVFGKRHFVLTRPYRLVRFRLREDGELDAVPLR